MRPELKDGMMVAEVEGSLTLRWMTEVPGTYKALFA